MVSEVSGGSGSPAMTADLTFQTPSVFGAGAEVVDSLIGVLGATSGTAAGVNGEAVAGDGDDVSSGLQPNRERGVKVRSKTSDRAELRFIVALIAVSERRIEGKL